MARIIAERASTAALAMMTGMKAIVVRAPAALFDGD